MTKIIIADKLIPCEHLLGQFLDTESFDLVIDSDTDYYTPVNDQLGSSELTEDRCIFKFRKNYFSKSDQDEAYIGLREAATLTNNRGIAAGPKLEKQDNREWFTEEQDEILEVMMNTGSTLDDTDQVQEIIDRYNGRISVSPRGQVWMNGPVTAEEFTWNSWLAKTRRLPKDQQVKEATRIANNFISDTTYANKVFSGVAGSFTRYPRIPYLRLTSYTEKNFDKFKMSFPFLQSLCVGFKELLPERYEKQRNFISKIDPLFVIPGTNFSTLTVNSTFRTGAHRDAGDFAAGFSNLCVITNGKTYSGGYLVLPEIRVAINIRPGDLLLIGNHEYIHGNTPIVLEEEGAERVSLVAYCRQDMILGGTKDYEDTRRDYVESCRANTSHSHYRPLFNGVWPGMWNSQEWKEFLLAKGDLGKKWINQYHPEFAAQDSALTLDEFFS